MKIIIKELGKKTPKEIIKHHINEYQKKGKEIRTEIRGDKILLFYINNNENNRKL